MNLSTVYCQNCRTANSLRETHCQQCGNRLLLVVFPNSLQYDTNHVPSYYEDHLLERVTALELKLGQTLEKLETAYDLIGQCIDISKRERLLFQAFLDSIEELNPEIAQTITKRSREIYRKIKKSEKSENRQQIILREIQNRHDHPNSELLTKLVSQGIELLAKSEEKEAFQMFDRAALLSPKNAALLLFIAEESFRVDKFAKAKIYLEKSLEFETPNPAVVLLLGAILADEGDLAGARKALDVILHHESKTRAAHLIRGILDAYEANWAEASASFNTAQGTKKTAEIEYLLGCAYFQLKRRKIALRHLQNAVELDPQFSDAYFMQSVVFEELKDSENAANARQKAIETKENGAQSLEFLSNSRKNKPENALPFNHFQKKTAKILFGGSLRLTKFIKQQILDSIN